MKRWSALASAAFAVFLFVGSAKAAIYRVDFTGNIDTVPAELSSQFDNTQTISGTYFFDSLATNVGSATQAVYNALLGFSSLTSGGYAASSASAAEI